MENSYPAGTIIEGTIDSIQSYGVFVLFGEDNSECALLHKDGFKLIKERKFIRSVYKGDKATIEIISYSEEHKKFKAKLVSDAIAE